MSRILSRGEPHSPPTPEYSADYPFTVRQGRFARESCQPVPVHTHGAIELIAVLTGELTLRVSGEEVALAPGEGALINSGRLHGWEVPEGGACELICVLLEPSLLRVNEAFGRELVEPFLAPAAAPYLKLRADRFQHREIYEKIKWIHRMAREPYAPLWVEAAFMEIWANFCENAPPPDRSRARRAEEALALCRMMDLVDGHYGDRLTLAAIAAAGGMGQSKCCRLFAAYLGESPIEYLTRRRLEESARMLIRSTLAIGEIALACGFGGASYFAETFHARFGVSPGAYRKTHTTENQSKEFK